MLVATSVVQTSRAATLVSPSGQFVVTARDPEVARQVAEYAEYYRQLKAVEWLGHELPLWERPCTIEVKVTTGGAGGATSFAFDQGQILSQQMSVEGSLERILSSVLPHEVTHTVFAARFRRPLPRWADEGGAVISEDYQELARHDLLVRQLINEGRMIPLSRLFILTEYPRDVMVLYAQGFSVAKYLVSLMGKPTYLDFVSDGQQYGWDYSVRRYLQLRSVPELEERWIEWLRAGRGTGADAPPPPPSVDFAQWSGRGSDRGYARAKPSTRVARGQMPDDPFESRPIAAARPTDISAPSTRSARAAVPATSAFADDATRPPGFNPYSALPLSSPRDSVRPAGGRDAAVIPGVQGWALDRPAPTASARETQAAHPRWTDGASVANSGRLPSIKIEVDPAATEAALGSASSDPGSPNRRLIPIAVGRTRRQGN